MPKLTIEGVQKKIARLTDNNDHNESILVLAKFLSNEEAVAKMQRIKNQHARLGHMPFELIQERMEIRKELMNDVEVTYGKETRNQINSAF